MDDATKKMLTTIVAPILRKGLITAGSALATHGIINSSQTETFVSLSMAIVGLAWSFWNDFGRAIVLSQLEVLKAKSLAQAAALHANAIPTPTAAEIADKSPTLTTEQVVKVAATLCLLLAFALTIVTPALAQAQPRKGPIGRVIQDIKAKADPQGETAEGDTNIGALRKRLLHALAKPFQDISDLIGDDVTGAIALSTVIPNIQDGHGQQCWIALRDFTDVSKAHPLPLTGQIATDLQAIRLQAIAANQLCSNIHCTQMFTDYSAMAQAVATAAVGAIGTLGAKALPSLSDACSKIPQIALVAPLNPVPTAADIKPVQDFLQPDAPIPAPTPPK